MSSPVKISEQALDWQRIMAKRPGECNLRAASDTTLWIRKDDAMGKSNPVSVEFNGKTLEFRSITAAAMHFGVPLVTAVLRLKRGLTPEEAFLGKRNLSCGLGKRKIIPVSVEVNGKALEFRSVRAAAKHFGLCNTIVFNRMQSGWTIEESLGLVPKVGTCVVCGEEFVHPERYSKPDKKFCSQKCADTTRDRDHVNAMQRARRKKDPQKYRDKEAARHRKNPEIKRASARRRYHENREERIKEHTAWAAKQMKTNPTYRLQVLLRDRLRKALKNNYKSGSAVRDLGCSIDELWQHLESQFKPGMTRENLGAAWQIDHIYPMAEANLQDPVEFLAVNNWRNLQPLTPEENNSKNNSVTPEAQELFNRLCKTFKKEVAA